MSRRRRPLRPEEEELWQTVARTAQPLHPRQPSPSPLVLPAALTQSHPKPAPPAVPMFRIGEAARPKGGPDLSSSDTAGAVKMDAKAFARMSRGKLVPEATLDLHGLTLVQAHPELIGFILNAQARGVRLALVITGKGQRERNNDRIPERPGILRRQVPLWLGQMPLSGTVLQVAEAHLRHGGGGAFYVYLRRLK